MARGFPGTGSTSWLGVNDPNDAFDPTTNAFTISLWVRLTSATGASSIIVAKWNGTTGWTVFQIPGQATIRFQVNSSNLDTGATISTGAWHHYAATKNGSAVACYVDGALSNSGTIAANLADTSIDYYWGHRASGLTIPIDGSIARVCAWRSVLTAAEIAALAKGVPPLLVRPASFGWHEGWGVGESGEPDLQPFDLATPKNLGENGTITVTDHAPVCPPFPVAV